MTSKTIRISASILIATMIVGTTYAEDWNGIYMGGSISSGQGDIEGTDFTTNAQKTLPMSGNLYGLHFGVNQDFGKLILGGEMAFSGGRYTFDGLDFNGVKSDTSIQSVRDAKLKVGYDAEKFMPYVVGGLTSAKGAEGKSNDTLFADFKGYALGAGAEYMFRPNIVVGLEYYQRNLEAVINGETSSENAVKLGDLALRVSYKF